jgi:hypothetical protein
VPSGTTRARPPCLFVVVPSHVNPKKDAAPLYAGGAGLLRVEGLHVEAARATADERDFARERSGRQRHAARRQPHTRQISEGGGRKRADRVVRPCRGERRACRRGAQLSIRRRRRGIRRDDGTPGIQIFDMLQTHLKKWVAPEGRTKPASYAVDNDIQATGRSSPAAVLFVKKRPRA